MQSKSKETHTVRDHKCLDYYQLDAKTFACNSLKPQARLEKSRLDMKVDDVEACASTRTYSSGRRQLGSNALARSSSFNSSGRSSNCDTTEDMYSDVSLENVQDISYKVSTSQDISRKSDEEDNVNVFT
uniref:Uncharacterized protein n=1 Tax=Glossina austeni TaxID=7395 RepID=A0A1A9URZ1_GLOAU